MKIGYLHGLEGNLSDKKRKILIQYGNVTAPEIDYRKPKILKELIFLYEDCDVIIGSSMGGYVGFQIALYFNKPCLLFNPAFPYRSIQPDLSDVVITLKKTTLTSIILGLIDNVIKCTDNTKFIIENLKNIKIDLKIREDLAHQIPISIFKEEVAFFQKQI